MKATEKIKSLSELKGLAKQVKSHSISGLALIKAGKKIKEIRALLGFGKGAENAPKTETAETETLDKNLNLPENPTKSDLSKAVNDWLRKNAQGKTITTIDGKNVFFNRSGSVDHLSYDGRRSVLAAKAMPYVIDVFKSGRFDRREEISKVRQDHFIAFHCYRKTVQIDDKNVLLEAKAGEKENGELEALSPLVAYHQKILSLDSVKEKGHFLPSIKSMDLNGGLAPVSEQSSLIFDNVQAENALLTIIEVTDLNGNPISFDDEIQPLDIPENATPQEREKLVSQWLRENIQGKTITAVDGKRIIFNRKLSTDHLSHNARKDESGIVTKCIPFITDVFKTGRFVERQELTKNRDDGKVAFHRYEKWVAIDAIKVLLEAKACEFADGRFEALGDAIAYNLKAAHLPSNLNPITDNALGGIEPLFGGNGNVLLGNVQAENEMATRTPSNLSSIMNNALGESLSPFADKRTPIFDNVQAENDYILKIKAITDLNGNPISVDDEAQPQAPSQVNQPLKSEMFNYNKAGESTPAKRQAANKKAIDIVKMLLDGSLKKADLTIEQKIALSEYSGNGGNMTDANGNKGSQYEYYTPKEIAGGMWDLLKASGFTGGKVLDPCAGTGIFSATAPDGILMENVELDEVSGTINKAIFESDTHKTTISPFEAVAAATPDEQYDAVITNVPFGSKAARGGNQLKDSQYQNESLDHYFILRSLKKLRPNGLAVFMCATKVLTGRRYRKQRLMMSEMAEFIGAYRLPDHVFGSAGAGVVTDVLVFKKHSTETKARIDDVLKEDKQGIKLLEKANVYWQPFLSGKYYQAHPANVLGSATQVKNRYGLVESIQSDATMADIAKLMQKLGGSRIDWEMLQSQEGGFITYQEGDTQYFDGVMKAYRNGKWETAELAENGESIVEQLQQRLSAYGSPLQIIEQKRPLAELLDMVKTVQDRQISLQILPDWLRVLMKQAA